MTLLFKRKKVGIVYGSDDPEREKNGITWLIPDTSNENRTKRYETVLNYLKDKYSLVLLDIKKLKENNKLLQKIKVIILIDVIVISEQKVRFLETFLRSGGTVFSAFPSMWDNGEDLHYTVSQDCPVLDSRLKHFFSPIDQAIFSEIKGAIKKSGYSDNILLNHTPKEIDYKGKAILVGSEHGIGELNVHSAKDPVTLQEEQVQSYGHDPILKRVYNNEGILIYVTFDFFGIFLKTGFGNLLDNLIDNSLKKHKPTDGTIKVKDVTRDEFLKLKTWVYFSNLLILSIFIFLVLALSRPQDFLSIIKNIGLSLIPPILFAVVKYGSGIKKKK